MRFSLRPGLSYCLIDGRPIFLDTERDRYFRLAEPLEDAFLALLSGASDHAFTQRLLDRAILVPGPPTTHRDLGVPRPTHSVIELTGGGAPVEPAAMLTVFAIVWGTRRRLRKHTLGAVLEGVVREREAARRLTPLSLDETQVIEAAAGFARSRLCVPVETSCLLDSLALTRYLARRGMAGYIVFGVTDSPFAAHCWVQVGELVLNDTVGNTMAYMPIRVV